MNRRVTRFAIALGIVAMAGTGGCKRNEDPPAQKPGAPAAPVTNRVDIPAPVRENLGISFAKVENRTVSRTLRLPGKFELLPEGRREHRTVLPGRVEVLVTVNQAVVPGTPLFRLDSPKWREMEQQIAEGEASVARARANAASIKPLRAARSIHKQSLLEVAALLEKRVEELERVRTAVGGKADELSAARTDLSKTKSDLGELLEKDAELDARERLAKVELDAALARLKLLVGTASTLCCPLPGTETRPSADWKSIEVLEARSTTTGIVESVALASGAWAEEATLVVRVVEPDRVLFRARALQSKVAKLAGVTEGRIVPPQAEDPTVALDAKVILGTALDSSSRSLDVFAVPKAPSPWARAGAAGFLEVIVGGAASPELAVPLSCVTRDGPTSVLFRRDPRDQDKVIRIDADLGIDDGRWIVVKSGVSEGDEIVLNGAWQLMLATSGSAAKGGHFHADGTFHEGDK